MPYSEQILSQAHSHSKNNKDELQRSTLAGCFRCLALFRPFSASAVERWVDGGTTAVCPACGVDALLGNSGVTPLTPEFLDEMKTRWFKHDNLIP